MINEDTDAFGLPDLKEASNDYQYTEVDLYVHSSDKDPNVSYSSQKVTVKWDLDLDIREWGAKSIGAMVPDQKITVMKTVGDEEVEEVFDLKGIKVELDAKVRSDASEFQFRPEELDITKNGEKVTAELQFHIR